MLCTGSPDVILCTMYGRSSTRIQPRWCEWVIANAIGCRDGPRVRACARERGRDRREMTIRGSDKLFAQGVHGGMRAARVSHLRCVIIIIIVTIVVVVVIYRDYIVYAMSHERHVRAVGCSGVYLLRRSVPTKHVAYGRMVVGTQAAFNYLVLAAQRPPPQPPSPPLPPSSSSSHARRPSDRTDATPTARSQRNLTTNRAPCSPTQCSSSVAARCWSRPSPPPPAAGRTHRSGIPQQSPTDTRSGRPPAPDPAAADRPPRSRTTPEARET